MHDPIHASLLRELRLWRDLLSAVHVQTWVSLAAGALGPNAPRFRPATALAASLSDRAEHIRRGAKTYR